MATELDRPLCGLPYEEPEIQEDSKDDSLSQLLDNGSVSFGRYAVESLAWEKRSAFTHDRRHEELEKLKAPGLVARKKAYFEEYYKRLRTIKSLQVIDKIEPPLDIVQVVDDVLRTNDSDGGIEIERPVDGVEAEVSAHLSNLTVQERQTENLMDENATVSLQQWIIRGQATSVSHKDTAAHELQKSSEVSGEEKEVEANHDTQSSVLLIDGSDSHIIAQLPSIDEDLSVREKRENPSSSLIMTEKMGHIEKSVADVEFRESILQEENSSNGSTAPCSILRKNKPSSKIKEKKNALSSMKEPHDRPVNHNKREISQATSALNGHIPLKGARAAELSQIPESRNLPGKYKCKIRSEVNGERSPKRVLHARPSKPVDSSLTRAGTSNRHRKQASSRPADRQENVKKPRQEKKPWR